MLVTPPEQGQLVTVRQRQYVVTEVAKSTLPDRRSKSGNGAQHLVTLSSVEDDALGEELQVIWEIEPGAQVIEKVALPEPAASIIPIGWMLFSMLSAGEPHRPPT